MSRWKQRVDDLLYEGESVRETVDLGSSRVVVTSHRVLAFTPEMAGENFTEAERPNVESVSEGARTDDDLLGRALQFGIVGGISVAIGYVVDFDGIFGDLAFNTEAAGRMGAGSLISVAQTLINIIAAMDFLLLAFGSLSLFLTAVLIGVYWFQRDPTLVIAIAGDAPAIHLPLPGDTPDARTRLETAIFPDAERDLAEKPGFADSSDSSQLWD